MNRAEILERYDVDENGIIQSPGKFESEMLYVPYLWDTDPDLVDGPDETTFYVAIVDADDRHEFPEIDVDTYAVVMSERESGFVDAEEMTREEYDTWSAENETAVQEQLNSEPQEDDITTEDHRTFYQYGRPAFEICEVVGESTYMVLVKGRQIGGNRIDTSGAGNGTYPDVESAIRAYMDHERFWPNVFWISDHGNAHRIEL